MQPGNGIHAKDVPRKTAAWSSEGELSGKLIGSQISRSHVVKTLRLPGLNCSIHYTRQGKSCDSESPGLLIAGQNVEVAFVIAPRIQAPARAGCARELEE